jgi:hypothetical protein
MRLHHHSIRIGGKRHGPPCNGHLSSNVPAMMKSDPRLNKKGKDYAIRSVSLALVAGHRFAVGRECSFRLRRRMP